MNAVAQLMRCARHQAGPEPFLLHKIKDEAGLIPLHPDMPPLGQPWVRPPEVHYDFVPLPEDEYVVMREPVVLVRGVVEYVAMREPEEDP